MAADDPVTLGEIQRSFQRLEQHVNSRFDRLDARIDDHHRSFVHADVYLAERAALNARLEAIEDSLRWTRRTFLGAAIGMLVTLLVPMIVLAVNLRGGG